MDKLNLVAGVVFVGVLVVVVWKILRRARRGYQTVQSLMAEVEAHAEATAQAQATAANRVDMHFGGGGYGGEELGELLRNEVRAAVREALGRGPVQPAPRPVDAARHFKDVVGPHLAEEERWLVDGDGYGG